jgi:hypothetical protein
MLRLWALRFARDTVIKEKSIWECVGGRDGAFVVRDHYVARLLDFLDLLAGAWRAARA